MSTTSSTPFALGVFVGNADSGNSSAEATFDASNQTFDSLMGATPTIMNAYIDQSQTPDEWANNAAWSAGSAEASSSWKGEIPLIGLPMGSNNADAPSADQILQNFANGTYDSMLQSMVKSWADAGFMTQYWRPGVEMNLGSTAGFVGSSTSMQADWVSAFQHIYTTLHAAATADGVNLKVIWNPGTTNDSEAGNPTETMYPGNQYVDVIGADVYADAYPYGNHAAMYDWDKSGQVLNSPNPVYDTSFQQWASDPINLEHYYTDPASDQGTLDGSGGSALSLQNLIDFAKAQGKPIAVCEAGAGSTGDGAGVPDNPTFVQWLSSTLESSGATVDFVSIWDSNGGGNYEFSNASDDKPQEAAAWAKYFGAQSTSTAATPITVTPATAAVSTTDVATTNPFTGVTITDGNASQTETAMVTMSSAANGTFFDPNAATDGSTVASGIWSVSGSATDVATALDVLVFTPTANQVAAGASVTTTVTATITDTAGETTSATSTITATQPVPSHAASAPNTQVDGTTGTVYDTSNNAWTITSGQQVAENGTVVPISAEVSALFWTGTALDQLNTSGDWWTQPLDGSAGTELTSVPAGYAAPAKPITITLATKAVSTTDPTTAKPFTGVAITDPNAGQTETARVTLSSAADGTLSDSNAATDHSNIVSGVLTVSGSATAVATDLDGLVFKPSSATSTPTVTTTVTAQITDTAGKAASATSTITATHAASAANTQVSGTAGTIHDTSGNAWTITSGQQIAENGTVVPTSAEVSALFWTGKALDQLNTSGDWWTQPLSGSAGTELSAAPAGYAAPAPAATTMAAAAVKDTAVEAAPAASTVTATQVPAASATPDILALQISQDAYHGNAAFTVSVNGTQVGGDYHASVLHASGDAGTFNLTGDWGSGVHDVAVSFINDANETAGDRNLYVNSITENGVTYAGTTASMTGDSTDTFAVGGTTPTAAAPADNLGINLSEDAWNGNADFVLYIDGKAVTTPQVVTALHDANATQGFSLSGDLGAGAHTIGIGFVNDASGASAGEERNLYINGITVNGSDLMSGTHAQDSNGISTFAFNTTH